jgi:hypothetical protein
VRLRAAAVYGDAEAVVPHTVPFAGLIPRFFMRLLLPFVLFGLASALASESEDAARRLLTRIPKRPATVVWQNLSTVSADEAERVRLALESGVEQAAGADTLRFTLSENPRSYLVIAESARSGVWMESWPKPAPRVEKPSHRLTRTVLWEQPAPILDIAVEGGEVYILEPMRVTVKGGRSTALVLPRPMPRDPRGRIEAAGSEGVKIRLPGVRCVGPVSKPVCSIAPQNSWIVAARNYFEGPRGRYYTSAELGGVLFQAETDGRTRVYFLGSMGDALRVVEGWGSELVAIESACGTHVVAALDTDQLQAFQYVGGNVKATTLPLVVDGPVQALWPSEKKDQVTVIVNNRTTGNYEASRVSVSCVQ